MEITKSKIPLTDGICVKERLSNARCGTRYFIVTVTEFHGEKGFSFDSLLAVTSRQDVLKCARRIAKKWYDMDEPNSVRIDKSDPDIFHFEDGLFSVQLDSIQEIPYSHYLFLKANNYVREASA